MEIVWGEPPAKTSGKYGEWFLEFTQALKARPGDWGELPPMKAGEAYSNTVQTTLRKHYPECEFTARPIPGNPNRIRLWGRYVEPETDSDHPANGNGLRVVPPGRMERVNAIAAQKNGK